MYIATLTIPLFRKTVLLLAFMGHIPLDPFIAALFHTIAADPSNLKDNSILVLCGTRIIISVSSAAIKGKVLDTLYNFYKICLFSCIF